MAIKTIISDLGGVLVLQANRAQPQEWEQRSGITATALFRMVDKAGLDRAATIGKVTSEEVWQRMAAQTGIDIQLFQELQEQFFAAEYINQELADFFLTLRPHYKMAALSNAWSGVQEALERKFALSQYFDEQFFSYKLGLAKPDTSIYQLVLHRLQIQPAQTIFLDNSLDNVDAADLMGMHSIHYRNAAQAIAAIQKALEKP